MHLKGSRGAPCSGTEQPGDYLRYLGRVDLHLVKLPEGWSLTDASATLIPLDQSIPEDPAIKAAIARMWPRKKTTQSTTQAAQGK